MHPGGQESQLRAEPVPASCLKGRARKGVSQLEMIRTSGSHLATFETGVIGRTWRVLLSTSGRDQDATKLLHYTGRDPTTKNHLAPNSNGAAVEKT